MVPFFGSIWFRDQKNEDVKGFLRKEKARLKHLDFQEFFFKRAFKESYLAERRGFEPPEPFGFTHFPGVRLKPDSATSPHVEVEAFKQNRGQWQGKIDLPCENPQLSCRCQTCKVSRTNIYASTCFLSLFPGRASGLLEYGSVLSGLLVNFLVRVLSVLLLSRQTAA